MKGRLIVIVIVLAGFGTAAAALLWHQGSERRKFSTLPPGDAAHPLVAIDTLTTITTKPHKPGTLLILGQSFQALTSVTLRGVEPVSKSDGLSLLTSRITFVRRATGKQPATGTAFGGGETACTQETWPGRSLGVTLDPNGLTLERGDIITTMFYVRIEAEGPQTLAGTAFRYVTPASAAALSTALQDVTFSVEGAPPSRAVACAGGLDPWLLY